MTQSESNRQPPNRRATAVPASSSWRRAAARAWFWRTTWGALVIIGAGVFNLFGLRTATEQYSELLLVLALAPLYPQPGEAPLDREDVACGSEIDSAGDWYAARRGATSVVLLDEPFLRQQNLHWPIPHAMYANLLRRIAMLRPAVIFLDVVLSDRHSPDDERAALVSTLQRIQAGDGPPVFAAAPNPCAPFPTSPEIHWEDPQHTLAPGRGLLNDIYAVVHPTVIQWWGYGNRYPVVIDRAQIRMQSGESDDECLAAKDGQWKWPSPAFDVYRAYYERCLRGRRPGRSVAIESFESPMLVRWGGSVARPDALSTTKGCAFVDPDEVHQRFGWSIWLFGRELVRSVVRLGNAPSLPCPYIESLSASAFFPNLSDATMTTEYRELLRRRIEGRAVFIGTSLFGGDYTDSPVNGQIAGVYEHAMAFDNLVQYGENYIRKQVDSYWRIDHTRRLEIGTAIAVLGILAAIRVGGESWIARRGQPGIWRPLVFLVVVASWLIACAGVIVFLVWIGLQWRESPVNYLGIFAGASVSNLGAVAILRGRRADWLERFSPTETMQEGESR